jgi:hypothetical protein
MITIVNTIVKIFRSWMPPWKSWISELHLLSLSLSLVKHIIMFPSLPPPPQSKKYFFRQWAIDLCRNAVTAPALKLCFYYERFDSWQGQGFVLFPKISGPTLGPPNLLSIGRTFFPWGSSSQGVKHRTHLQLIQRLSGTYHHSPIRVHGVNRGNFIISLP